MSDPRHPFPADRPFRGGDVTHESPPSRVDIAARASEKAQWMGQCALALLPRLTGLAEQAADGAAGHGVSWQAAFSTRNRSGRAPQPWLHLGAQARLVLVCQRCLAPVTLHLSLSRDFRFVADEQTAAAEDEDSEEDVLVTSPRFDLLGLLEDELLMALPLVPMHDACSLPTGRAAASAADRAAADASAQQRAPGLAADGDSAPAQQPHPFAVLGRLKAGPVAARAPCADPPDGRDDAPDEK